ncbi:prepilin-type N-terminal cleavage/methylation domain-containing protein [Roseibacillus ishigakijimensis]|uniref:Prepilin-type N-terminal cleavage/methylation domain-containing protein n=1 Tax=Roseibacillus ishigakijimensis TaxID=454146 RepID=A0A934RK95_9BACT|nr:prepilin-type N-terminal cleavage/methylation domain-containing protein [Roseibacillus ishigakijimensis]MBK1833257.1 prepilin-type N-terminal cleavage/methylation domain-containing protein [Roseibacillus ishigakijimensis]
MMRNNSLSPAPSRGFTLIELLVVIGIMAVMLSVAAIGIQNIDKGQATVSGLSQTQALMDEARNLAIGRGTRARLCIHAESNEEDRYLRFFVVAYEEIEYDDSGEETGRRWRVASRGTFLPTGVYFHPTYSTQASNRVDGLGTFNSKDEAIRFPGDSRSTRNPNYYYYEFNAEGLCVAEGENDPGAAFVLARGVTRPGAQDPTVIGKDVAGFVIWRNGRTSPIRDTEFITN